MRTSQSHPLVIASVDALPGFGRIGMTFCPGKTQPNASTSGWARDLVLDLDVIAAWGASPVVTLLEPHKFDVLSVPTLGEEVARRHMSFVHLPIQDGSVPGVAFETAWVTIGEGLRARLRICAPSLQGRAGANRDDSGTPADRAWRSSECGRRACSQGTSRYHRKRCAMTHVHAASVLPESFPAPDSAALEDRAAGALLGLPTLPSYYH